MNVLAIIWVHNKCTLGQCFHLSLFSGFSNLFHKSGNECFSNESLTIPTSLNIDQLADHFASQGSFLDIQKKKSPLGNLDVCLFYVYLFGSPASSYSIHEQAVASLFFGHYSI
jgi:hypothetical protein